MNEDKTNITSKRLNLKEKRKLEHTLVLVLVSRLKYINAIRKMPKDCSSKKHEQLQKRILFKNLISQKK